MRVCPVSSSSTEAVRALPLQAVARVYMRSKMIKHNKDLFESLDDPMALLEKLHIY